jgi:MFS transporter, DHA2 family, multidrug resistance protein
VHDPTGPPLTLRGGAPDVAGHPRRWAVLAVLSAALYVVVADTTIVNVALPTFVRELGASTTQLQWIVDAYNLVFASLLLAAGGLGDRTGRARALTVGLVVFGATSSLAAFVDTTGALIAVRALMGIGAALVFPATLAILSSVFPRGRERAIAIGIWSATSGVAVATGPVLGGALLEQAWWGAIFLVNVPIVLVTLVAVRLLVPDSRDEHPQRFDTVGAVTSIVGIGALVFAIIELPSLGWRDPLLLASAATAVVALVTFARWEARHPHPMLPVRLFRDPRFSAASFSIAAAFFGLFGFIFLITQHFQFALGFGPLEAGVRTLPFAAATATASLLAPVLVGRIGTKLVVAAGLTSMAVGFLWTSGLTLETSYLTIVGQMVLLGGGLGLTSAPATESVMGAVPEDQFGIGSAVNDTTREVGGTLGVAVVGSVFASIYASTVAADATVRVLPSVARDAVSDSLGAASIVAEQLPAPLAGPLLDTATLAFIDALAVACLVVAGVTISAAAVVLRWLPARATPVVEMPPAARPPTADLTGSTGS